MWNEMGNMSWGWWGVGAIHMILFWGFLILAIILVIRFLTSGVGERQREFPDSALEVLKIRYANGEIDRDEFEEKKRDLQD
jgi:putative membrane protein